jgi:hypothetical protein
LQCPDVDAEIVKQILRYFVNNQRVVDSLEGIARWRLLESKILHNLRQTEAGLRWLVEHGFLEEIRPVGAAPLFRLDPGQKEEAVRFLGGGKNPKDEK